MLRALYKQLTKFAKADLHFKPQFKLFLAGGGGVAIVDFSVRCLLLLEAVEEIPEAPAAGP
jgi:hypothetical protein